MRIGRLIYVIGTEDGPQKVGIASDLRNRVSALQTGSYAELKSSFSANVSPEECRDIEKYAHHLLRRKRLRGEWFDVGPDEAANAVRQAIIDVRDGKKPQPDPEAMSKRLEPAELQALRKRLGWSQRELSRRLDISVSRLADYECGHTRGPQPRPAPIPRVVEYAIKYLTGDQEAPF